MQRSLSPSIFRLMRESDDDATVAIDRALSETQRLEREELAASLERQRAADERVVDALANRES